MGRRISNLMVNVRSTLTTGVSTSIKSHQHTQTEIDHTDSKIKNINADSIEDNVDYNKAETLFSSQRHEIEIDDGYEDNEQIRRTSFQQINAGRRISFGGILPPPL